MHAQLRDLTQGPLAKQILLFSLPLIASNLLQTLHNPHFDKIPLLTAG